MAHRLPTEDEPLLPTRFEIERTVSSSDDEDSENHVDIEELSLSLVHAGGGAGLFSGSPSILGNGSAWQSYERRPSRPRKVTIPSNAILPEPQKTASTVPYDTVDAEQHPQSPDEEDEDVRFIGIRPAKFWVVFLIIMLCYFVACFDSTLMASSHPVITSYFNASQAASWLSTVFLITSTAFQPLFGRFSDMIGRRPVFVLALMIFCLTTLWCALATSIKSFIAARAVCGIGAGGTMALSLIIISDLVHIEFRGVFQSYINIAYGLGSASGAAFGGFLCDRLGWRWSFGIQVPALAICAAAAVLVTPKDLGPTLTKQQGSSPWKALKDFDSAGSALLLAAITSLILTLNLGGILYAWTSPIVLAFAITSAVSIICFVWQEKRTQRPLMPLPLLIHKPTANLILSNFFGAIASNAILFNAPLFFQAVLLTSASDSGLRLAVPNLAGSCVGVCTGYIITYTRALKPTLVAGGISYLLGAVAILLLGQQTPEFVTLLLISGVPMGQGFVFPNTMMSALAVSSQSEQAVVTTTIGLWRNLGMVVGIALSSLVFQNSLLKTLRATVTGIEKDDIIHGAISNVEFIKGLDPLHLSQVTSAYAVSLRAAFSSALVAALFINVLVLPVRLPKLKSRVPTSSLIE